MTFDELSQHIYNGGIAVIRYRQSGYFQLLPRRIFGVASTPKPMILVETWDEPMWVLFDDPILESSEIITQ